MSRMTHPRKTALTLLFLLILTSPVIGLAYQVWFQENRIETYLSADRAYELAVCQIGAPDWPFGAAHCRFELRSGGRTISKLRFDVHDDGMSARPKHFHVHWFPDFVRVVVTASEQPDALYDLYYDGNTEVTVQHPAAKTAETYAAEKKMARDAAIKQVSRVLELDIPAGGEVQYNLNTHNGFHGDGKTYIQIRFRDGGPILEQLEARSDWRSLPLPEELRLLGEYARDSLATDEELGEGYWFFLDRHSEAVDRRDYSAARQRFSVNFILAFYSVGEETLCFCQMDS